MPYEIGLLGGNMGWRDFQAARERYLHRFSRRTHDEHWRAIIRLLGLFEAWNAHDADGIAAQFTPDGVRHQFAFPETRLAGRRAIAGGCGEIIHAVPDCRLDVRSEGITGDGRVSIEWTFTGTHVNDLPGMPAAGNTLRLPGMSVYTLTADGHVALEHAYWDTATLMAAAGAPR